jgi:hypothetical protein
VTGFTETFLMATGFLVVCLLAGLLVPRRHAARSTADAGARIELAAPDGVRG